MRGHLIRLLIGALLTSIAVAPGGFAISAVAQSLPAQTLTVSEGGTFQGIVGTLVSSAGRPCSTLTAQINWGDSTGTSVGTVQVAAAGGCNIGGTHTYAEEGSYVLTVTIYGGATALAFNVTVSVADAPLGASGYFITPTKGTLYTGVIATFTDPDGNAALGDYTANVDWGDGKTSTAVLDTTASGAFNVIGAHTFTVAARRTVKVTISDANTTTQAATLALVGIPPFTQNMSVRGRQLSASTDLLFSALTHINGTVTGRFTFHDNTGANWPGPVSLGAATYLSVVCTGKHSGYLYGNAVFNETPITFLLDFTGNGPYDGQSMPDTYRVRVDNGYDSGDIGSSLIHLVGG